MERLLAGERRVDDLTHVFLAQRERFHGRAAFLEVGDYIAHRDLRTKGLASRKAKDYAILWRAQVWHARTKEPPPGLDWAAYFRANVRHMSDEKLLEISGLRRDRANTVAGRILSADFGSRRRLTQTEDRFLDAVSAVGEVKALFTADELLDDFSFVCRRNRLISDAEADQLGAIKPFLSLFALAQMHGCSIEIGDGTRVPTLLATDPATLGVWANIGCPVPDAPDVYVGFCFFDSGLPPKDHCSDGLIRDKRILVPIEIGADGKLVAL